MRCPKCGFISFDHLDTCRKCKKEIKQDAETLHGTVFNATPPSFLRFTANDAPEETSDFDGVFDESEVDLDTLDPDLDILIDSDEEETGEQDFKVDEAFTEDELADDFEFDSDDEEISLDFNQFEDSELGEDTESDEELSIDFNQVEDSDQGEDTESEEDFTMELPDELQDISDLEPQEEIALEENLDPVDETLFDEDEDEGFDMSLDIGDLADDIDLDLGKDSTKEETVTLDEPVATTKSPNLSLESKKDEDEELNFDLDLGGLSLEDD